MRKIGQGGMGAVYEAEQDNPRRTVALKVILSAVFASSEAVRRFELEAQVLGLLQHPGIAQIFEAGQFEVDGELRPFFALELIRGEPLLEWAEHKELSTRDRLALIAAICDAVHHAHQRGVVHRDLKPGNILVTEDGQPKVLDFGVARATNVDIQTATLRTDVGQLIGTLPYMSPEQASGDPARIDSRSDVYSLGVVAYQLLSGRMPYDLDRAMLHDAVRIVREVEAQPLSTALRSLRGDVETIVGKALEKEVERRYDSASALASDIRRYLHDEPIQARPPSSIYQLKKFAKRNKAFVGGVVAVFLALLVGLIGTWLGFVEARRNAEIAGEKTAEASLRATEASQRAEEARVEALRANRTATFLREILAGVDPSFAQGVDTKLLERILATTAERIEADLEDLPTVEVDIRSTLGSTYHAIGKFDQALTHYERAAALQREIGGEDAPESLLAQMNVASTLGRLGRSTEAIGELTALRERASIVLGVEHGVYDHIRCELGVLLMERQDLQQAAELFDETVRWRRGAYGSDDERTLVALNCLGLVRSYLNRFAEAEELLIEVRDRRQRLGGPQHPETIKALHNLGAFYSDRGRYAEAEPLIRQANDAYLVVLGAEHPTTLGCLSGLATLLRRSGRGAEARELYERVLDAQRRVSGPDHPDTLSVESHLGIIHRDGGNTSEAIRLHQHVLDVERRNFGDEDPKTLGAESNLASDFMRAGREAEGEAIFERLAEVMPGVLGERHASTLIVLNDLGIHYMRTDRLDEAERLFRRTLAARTEEFGAEHPDTLISAGSLGLVLQKQGRHAEALPHLAAMLAGWSRLHGDENSATRNTAERVLASAELIEDPGPSEPELRVLVEHHRRRKEPDRGQLARSLVVLGESLTARWRADEAAPLLEEAVETLSALGANLAPQLACALGVQGAVRMAQGQVEDAEALLAESWERLGDGAAFRKKKVAAAMVQVHQTRGDAQGAALWSERAKE